MKHFFSIVLVFCFLSINAQVYKIAILETVDKEGNISYAHKLMLRANIAKAITNAPGFEAYDRTDMDAIMSEQNFQRTGMVSEDQIKRLGEMTGANFILVAEAVKVDENNMFITAKILNVETAKTEATDNVLMSSTPSDIQHGCESLASKLLGLSNPMNSGYTNNTPSTPSTTTTSTTTPTISRRQRTNPNQGEDIVNTSNGEIGKKKVFADGSVGIVFYYENGHGLAVSLDKTTCKWDNKRSNRQCQDIASLPNEEGTKLMTFNQGEDYTQRIIQNLGTAATAAQWCTQLGKGWYMPSCGELWYLLEVANQKSDTFGPISKALQNNGGWPLTDGWYWSSSEHNYDEAINVSSSGRIASEEKTESLHVRAVRSF